MTLRFTAYGVAQPKGSARAFVPKGWKRAIVTSTNPKNKGWQQVVAEAANLAITEVTEKFEPFLGPVQLTTRFFLPRPKSIKEKTVPHTTKPDLDKLVRSVKDALTGVAWGDDKQVTIIAAEKHYAEPRGVPRVEIEVRGIPPPVRLQDGLAPEWTCDTCGGDLLFCACRR